MLGLIAIVRKCVVFHLMVMFLFYKVSIELGSMVQVQVAQKFFLGTLYLLAVFGCLNFLQNSIPGIISATSRINLELQVLTTPKHKEIESSRVVWNKSQKMDCS